MKSVVINIAVFVSIYCLTTITLNHFENNRRNLAIAEREKHIQEQQRSLAIVFDYVMGNVVSGAMRESGIK